MAPIDTLSTINKSPAMLQVTRKIAAFKRLTRPVAPVLTRLLIISTFIEDGLRTLSELPSQQIFFKQALGIPAGLAKLLIIPAVLVSLASAVLFMVPKLNKLGAKMLMGCVLYQQLIYGRHSAITTGNLGFFIRNLCMSGTLALFLYVPSSTPSSNISNLSNINSSANINIDMDIGGLLPGSIAMKTLRKGAKDNAALIVRVLFAVAAFEMYDVVGWWWSLLIIPCSVSLVIGFQAELCSLLIMGFYAVGAVVANPFWTISVVDKEALHLRELMRYEFIQTVSILGGLMLIIMSGPGAFSVDNKLRQGKAW